MSMSRLTAMQEMMTTMRGEIVAGMLQMMGTDDILAKAAIEASIDNVGQSLRRSDPGQWAPMLRLYGFALWWMYTGMCKRSSSPGRQPLTRTTERGAINHPSQIPASIGRGGLQAWAQ